MNAENLQEYLQWLSDGNSAFQWIENHPIMTEIKKDPKLRFWIPKEFSVASESNKDTSVDMSFWEKVSTRNIASFLRLSGYDIDYKNRTASNDGKKNYKKIGRILQEINEPLVKYWKKITNTDVISSGGKRWVISANPVDICNATYRRRWSSCLSGGHFFSSINNHNFSLIAYLCDENDTEIADPYCRYLLHIGRPVEQVAERYKETKTFKFDAKTPIETFVLSRQAGKAYIEGKSGVLCHDTKYGTCSSEYNRVLLDFIAKSNDIVLDTYKVKSMEVAYSGLYINRVMPYRCNHTSSVIKKINKKSVKSVKIIDPLLQRINNFDRYSIMSYQLIEYVINNQIIPNKWFVDAVKKSPRMKELLTDKHITNMENVANKQLELNKSELVKNINNDTMMSDILKKINHLYTHAENLKRFKEQLA